MTTIAWDGRELAADRAAWSGVIKYRVRKVYRIVGKDGLPNLVAITGSGAWAAAWIAWRFRGGERPGDYPTKPGEAPTAIIALVVDHRRRVWEHTQYLHRIRRYGRIQATGAGQELALGAMAAGATAREAVLIAAKHSDVSGLGVDVVRL